MLEDTPPQIPGLTSVELAILIAWAKSVPKISRIWIFGSRATGKHRADSDLDLAVELFGRDEGERLGDWICLGSVWRKTLHDIMHMRVHAQMPTVDDVVVMPAVLREGILVFDRAAD